MYIYILLVFPTVVFAAGLKYDVEEESKKLYGEDLNSVLKRFRRTSDYLRILNEEMEEINNNYNDIQLLVKMHVLKEVQVKIQEMLGIGEADNKPELSLRFGQRGIRMNGLNAQREGDQEPTVTMTPVERLDNYGMLSRHLTVQQINMFKDMGFEYTGEIIHKIIKSLGNEDFSLKSTKQPFANNDKRFTTVEHVHKHEIKSTLAQIIVSTPPHEGTHDEGSFRYRNNKLTEAWAQHSRTKKSHHTII